MYEPAEVALVAPCDCTHGDRPIVAGQIVMIPVYEQAGYLADGWTIAPADDDGEEKPKKKKEK